MISILIESLEKGDVAIWNDWKISQPFRTIFFTGISFHDHIKYEVVNYDFSGVIFLKCKFRNMHFADCNFERTIFKGCRVYGTRSSITGCNFKNSEFYSTKLSQTSLNGSVLSDCIFNNCILKELNFYESSLINSSFKGGSISDSNIFGANVWSITTEDTVQKDLKMNYISNNGSKNNVSISIDDIELSNIVYLLAANPKITNLVNQSKSSFVLILGRFGENMARISIIKERLRDFQYSPLVFDFKSPDSLDLIEMIVLLALLSKFIIIDLSEPKSVPAELQAILGVLMIPIVPIIHRESDIYGTYSFTNRYKWVLPILVFDNISEVANRFKNSIIEPAVRIYDEILKLKKQDLEVREAKSYKQDE